MLRNVTGGGNAGWSGVRSALVVTGVCIVSLSAGSARADWPTARHDPQRTGVAQSSSDITKPAVYWKAYVGGAVTPEGFLAGDVDQNGSSDLLYVSGGAVYATSPSGQLLWRTPPRGIQSIFAIDDFDGDGLVDVLVAGTSQAMLLAGKDGSFEWTEDPTDFGTLGSLRVTDLNGDGRPDVVAEECHCCQVTNGASGFAFSFARTSGVLVGTKLWTMPAATGDFYSCGVPTVVFDGTGNGSPQLAHAGGSHVYVLASDGSVLVDANHSPALGDMLYDSDCLPANVDGQPGDELVCFQEIVNASDPAAVYQVFVLHLDTTTSPASLDLLWRNTTLADQTDGALDYEPGAVADLDGNGTMEVVVSGEAAGVWTTYVFDAKTGTTLATIPSARSAGTAALRSDGKLNILTTDGVNVTAWIFDPTQPSPIQSSWVKPNRHTMTRVDSALLRTLRANTDLVLPDLNQDGIPELLTSTVSPGTILYDDQAGTGAPNQIASFTFPADVDPIATWILPPTTRAYAQVGMAANDGVLRVFDSQLQPTVPFQVGGFCAGGWQQSPVVASLTGAGGTQSVFVTDSRSALLRFDAQNASLANPPQPQWSARNCSSPTVFQGIDGARPGIVCRGAQQPLTNPALPALSAVRGDGSLIWNAPLQDKGAINDALPGSLDASGSPAVLVQTADNESRVTTWSFSGSTGAPGWSTAPIAPSWGAYAFSAADWNGDGVTDVVTILNSIEAISGVNGQTITAGTDFLAYGVPVLSDPTGSGVLEATVQGGYYPARTLQHDLTTATWMGPNTEPYQAGALASCPGAPQLVEGSTLFPSRLYLTVVAGSAAGTSSTFVLAGGKQYPDEATATAAGAYLGTLSDLSISTNLTGSGQPTAVVGSSDGWLYGLDACSGALQFTVPLNESICGAVFGDTDADGHDEILVGTSGGYLYDLKNAEIGSCGPVFDVDPPSGIMDREVSQLVTESTLFGSWQAVPGASGYQVAVTHAPEGIISDPQWQDVGTATSAAVTGLPLVIGQTYVFAVHAVGPQGVSVDALSAGVTVVAPGTSTATSPSTSPSSTSGCACETGATGSRNELTFVAGLALVGLVGIRRSRRTKAA